MTYLRRIRPGPWVTGISGGPPNDLTPRSVAAAGAVVLAISDYSGVPRGVCPDLPDRSHRPGERPAGTVASVLKLGRGEFEDAALLVMAIVNRTRDSFYDHGATWEEERALDRVRQVVARAPTSWTSAG